MRRSIPFWRTTAGREGLVLGAVIGAFALSLVPALAHARREFRDGIRRQILRETKTELELWFNDHDGFPLHPSGALDTCGTSVGQNDWFFVGILEHDRKRPLPRDPRPFSGFAFRYCPTVALLPSRDRPLASGFVLDVPLENSPPNRSVFNTEYNIFERTVTIKGRTYYQICGGTDMQCGTERPEE